MMQHFDAVRGKVSAEAEANIHKWLTEQKYVEYVDEVVRMIKAQSWQALEDAFFKEVEFGTGGRRGTTGVGPNRINKVTIGESAQALCQYAVKASPDAPQKGIVIACDTRLSSKELSEFTASVCAANGFKTYIFDSFRSTPELSFAVRHLQAAAGIVISASHNPPADNGFKAYWSDGGQIVAPHDKGILTEASHIQTIKSMDFHEAVDEKKINVIGAGVDEAYWSAVTSEAMGDARELAIVYSPLHGAGQTNVLPTLRRAGFNDVRPVEAQMVPDGNFPTIPNGKPNPEEKLANEMAVEKMLIDQADIAITNDPDADRIGVVVRQGDEAIYLNGNQSAVLAADFALRKLSENNHLNEQHYLAKTIVTTDMLSALAEYYGATMYSNMLVGFKYIGELIKSKEDTDETFVIGGEESYGLLKGTYARDKDGAIGALLLAEYAAELKQSGLTLYDRLLELYAQHGLYIETLTNTQLPGADGFSRMQAIMQELRQSPPEALAGYEVTAVLDYQSLTRTDMLNHEASDIDCARGDVVVFELGDSRRRITVRPSGTEPKLKLYIQWFEEAKQADTAVIKEQFITVSQVLSDLAAALEQQVTA